MINKLGRTDQCIDDRRPLFLRWPFVGKEGNNLFRAPADAVGLPVDAPRLAPGSVERSNVQAIRELATMMILQRNFDASMQVLQSGDQATDQLIKEFSQ